MVRTISRPPPAERVEATSGNVLVRFKADRLKRIHNYEIETTRKEYEQLKPVSSESCPTEQR